MIGRTLSHYRIVEALGSGGMGEVYAAEDTKLSRKVALKVLPQEMASEERLARFEREAKAIAALNHPNIVHVYSVEEADGVHFITMELVRGKTMTELLPKHGFPLAKFFDIATPLADAVAAAHEEGITHRDLKPDNVMVGDDGRVKVLDFGLAKPAGLTSEAGNSELATKAKTQEGAIIGTVHYMSPEQAAGKAVEPRSDIFSLGILFHEMLTGRRPFKGDTPTEVLSAIIKDTPPPIDDVPRELSKLVGGDMQKLTTDPTPDWAPRWSPDGKQIAFTAYRSGNRDVWVKSADGGPATQLTNSPETDWFPSWSPDGSEIAFAKIDGLWAIAAGGGEARRLSEQGNRPDWSPDGQWIAYTQALVVPVAGGDPKPLALGLGSDETGRWSRDGKKLLFCRTDDSGRNFWAVSVDDGVEQQLTALEGRAGDLPPYAPASDGKYMYFTWDENIGDIWVMDVVQE